MDDDEPHSNDDGPTVSWSDLCSKWFETCHVFLNHIRIGIDAWKFWNHYSCLFETSPCTCKLLSQPHHWRLYLRLLLVLLKCLQIRPLKLVLQLPVGSLLLPLYVIRCLGNTKYTVGISSGIAQFPALVKIWYIRDTRKYRYSIRDILINGYLWYQFLQIRIPILRLIFSSHVYRYS